MPTRPSTHALLALAAVTLAVAAAGAARVIANDGGSGDVLVSDDDRTEARTGTGSIGQPYTFGIRFFTNTSDHEVRFVDVRPVDPTPGLVIDGIRAIHQCDPRNGGRAAGGIGGIVGTIEDKQRYLHPEPISAATVAPHTETCWYFVVTAHADDLGTYEAKAFDLVYTVNGHQQVHRRNHGIALVITSRSPDPRAQDPPETVPPTPSG